MFLAYAKAYRLTGDPLLREMVGSLAQGMGWGDILNETTDRVCLTDMGLQNDICAIFGLLELHRATDEGRFLNMAADMVEELARRYLVDGFFTTGEEGRDGCTHINGALPLALLHLANGIEEAGADIPAFYPGSTSFDPKVIIARRRRDKEGRR